MYLVLKTHPMGTFIRHCPLQDEINPEDYLRTDIRSGITAPSELQAQDVCNSPFLL
jgi:hypothetical protein